MEGSIWVLLVALLVFGTSLLFHRFIEGRVEILRLPMTWFYSSWLFGLALLALPLYKYFEAFTASTASYVLAILFASSLGSITAAFWTKYRMRSRPLNFEDDEAQLKEPSMRWLFVLLISGLIGTSLVTLNTFLGGSLSIGERLDADNLSAIRSATQVLEASRIGILHGPANFLWSIGGLGVAYVSYMAGARTALSKRNRRLYFLAASVLTFNIFLGVVGFGGRVLAVFAILGALIAFSEGRWSIGERLISRKPDFKSVLTLLVASVLATNVLWAASTSFLEKRVQGMDPQALLMRTHRASLSPIIYDLTRGTLPAQYLMFTISYMTTPIPTLVFYLDLPQSRQAGPYFGEYNFPAIARWVRRLTFSGDPLAWDRQRYEIFKPLADINFGTNVWSTLVRDLIADFGKYGALVFVFALSFYAQRSVDIQRSRPSVQRAGLLVHLRLLMLFSGLVSILFQPQFHWSLYLAVFLTSIAGQTPQKALRKNAARALPLASRDRRS